MVLLLLQDSSSKERVVNAAKVLPEAPVLGLPLLVNIEKEGAVNEVVTTAAVALLIIISVIGVEVGVSTTLNKDRNQQMSREKKEGRIVLLRKRGMHHQSHPMILLAPVEVAIESLGMKRCHGMNMGMRMRMRMMTFQNILMLKLL